MLALIPEYFFLNASSVFLMASFLREWSPLRGKLLPQRSLANKKKEADHNHNMFLAPFDLLVAVDPMVSANMARGPWAAYAAGSLSSTYA